MPIQLHFRFKQRTFLKALTCSHRLTKWNVSRNRVKQSDHGNITAQSDAIRTVIRHCEINSTCTDHTISPAGLLLGHVHITTYVRNGDCQCDASSLRNAAMTFASLGCGKPCCSFGAIPEDGLGHGSLLSHGAPAAPSVRRYGLCACWVHVLNIGAKLSEYR